MKQTKLRILKLSWLRQPVYLIPWIFLGLALGAVLFLWYQQEQLLQTEGRTRFEREAEQIKGSIVNRLSAYEDVLQGLRGFFNAKNTIDQDEVRQYINALVLEERHHGTTGVGFIEYLPANKLQAFTEAVRKDGASSFEVKPAGERQEYYVIKYVEPLVKNFATRGFDIATDPIQREAAERARDTKSAIITQKLLIEEQGVKEPGFVLFLPVYRPGLPLSSITELQSALVGWVYASFQVNPMLKGIIGQEATPIDLAIFDGVDQAQESLLYNGNQPQVKNNKPSFTYTARIAAESRTWTLYLTSQAAFDASINHNQPTVILIVGIIASLLLFLTIWLIVGTRIRLTRTLDLLKGQSDELQTALANLEERQRSTQAVSTQVLSLAAQLTSTAGQQANGSQQQVAVVTEVANSMSELSGTATNIDKMANDIKEAAGLAAGGGQQIEKISNLSVIQSEQGMLTLNSTVTLSYELAMLYQQLLLTITELKTKSTNTRRILEVLKSLSEETHLLALNAAIEAVGAGQYGERFKVVAQEVKRLATRSAQSNSEVAEIVRQVESATLEALQAAENGYQKALEMEESVNQTGQVFGKMREVAETSQLQVSEVLAAVKRVNGLSEIIRAATNQQRDASQQVSQALNGLSTVARQSAEASSQVSSAAGSLELLSYNLNKSFS